MARTKKFRKNGRGSIMLISCLLVGSAAVRIGSEAGKAVATENAMPAMLQDDSMKASQAKAMNRDGLQLMLADFESREARITRLEQEIEARKKALDRADLEITKRLTVLETAENSLRDMLAIADTAAEEDLTTLTTVYENMKPKEAAALFEEMEPTFAAGFLGRMRPDAAAGIMAGLTPQTAYTISVILAGRNADAPKG